jgi:tetratricopeptide (TPR) repeat protein
VSAEDWAERSRLQYERAVLEGDAATLEIAAMELDGVEAQLALARGRIMHGRFLARRAQAPGRVAGDPAELTLFERAERLYAKLGDARGQAEALFWVACYRQVVTGDNGAAVPLLRQSLDLATQCGDKSIMAEAERHLGIAEHAAGRLDTARQHLEQSAALRWETGHLAGVASNLVGLIYIAAAQGRRSEGLELVRQATDLAQATGAQVILRQVQEARAAL